METVWTLTMNPAIDISTSVERVKPDRKLRCDRPRLDPGGGGINVARAMHRLGGAALALYACGGHSGRVLQELLEGERLDHRSFSIEEPTREDLTVTEMNTGQQFRFVLPGPRLSESEWKRCLEEISGLEPSPRYLVASGSLPPGVPSDFYAQLGRRARERGIRFVLDASGQPLQAAAQEGAFLIKPNRKEAEQMVDQALGEDANLERAMAELVGRGRVEAIVVSLGAEGALLVTGEGIERIPGIEVEVTSRIGAGDSMVAGMTLALARGESLREAIRFGVAAGSAAVMTPGTELCRRADTERLYERMQGA